MTCLLNRRRMTGSGNRKCIVLMLWANQEMESVFRRQASGTTPQSIAAFRLVSCRSPVQGRWRRGGASGPQMGRDTSVSGVGAWVDRPVYHRSLVSRARAAVEIFLAVHLPAVPAHHHDNHEQLAPRQSCHLQERFNEWHHHGDCQLLSPAQGFMWWNRKCKALKVKVKDCRRRKLLLRWNCCPSLL